MAVTKCPTPVVVTNMRTGGSVTLVPQGPPRELGGDPQFDEDPVRGTSNPHIGYSHNTAQSVTFNCMIVSSVEAGDPRTPSDVHIDCLYLRKWRYPTYETSSLEFTRAPDTLMVSYGTGRTWYGVMPSLNIEEIGPVDLDSGYHFHARVEFTIRCTIPRLGGSWEIG